jgi:hypothetical protein
LVDGWLFRVGALVNDRTIKFVPSAADQDIYHIRVDSHDVIYAQGAPIETLAFEGEAYCAPDVPYRGRAEIWSRARSAISPWIDIRQPVEVIRDRFEERALAA